MTYSQFVNLCEKYNINIDEEIYTRLTNYYHILVEENSKYNLTAITDEEEVFYKHFFDSMLGSSLIKDNSSILDIGCGAGFPSVPLSLIKPNSNFTLVDAVNKKVNFINTLKQNLSLDNITAIHSRCEDLAKNPKYRESFDIVVNRAVAAFNIILEYSIPFLKVGGKLIAYKGKNVDEELINIDNALNKLNCKIIDKLDIYIKEIDSYRSFVVVEKTAQTANIYPRLQNKVRKNPL